MPLAAESSTAFFPNGNLSIRDAGVGVDFIDICGLPMVISSSKVTVEAKKE